VEEGRGGEIEVSLGRGGVWGGKGGGKIDDSDLLLSR